MRGKEGKQHEYCMGLEPLTVWEKLYKGQTVAFLTT